MKATNDVFETEHFKKLTALVDKLRDIGLSEHVSMPRIAVLGSQSSGKSSLLESIVGLNFLPRGSGVVTRRPLELRLFRTQTETPFAVFAAEPETRIADFDRVRRKIEQLTEEVCGRDKNIVDDPIVLRVHSQDCPDLTVIDLPGITRIPIGNQPKDIERVTKDLVSRYCRDERTIILCVIPANADISTSEALQLARTLDPQGQRTVGVITKIDIMDRGTDARKLLLNKEIPLRLGYVGVKGRSQLDVDNAVTVSAALSEEKAFFAEHAVYRHLPAELLGTVALVDKLTRVMFGHIRRVLPRILNEIGQKVQTCERGLAALGPPIPSDNREKLDQIWRDVSLFYEKFKSQLKGDYLEQSSRDGAVLASAQIQTHFNGLYKNFLLNSRRSEQYSDAEIARTLSMYSGNSLPGFLSADCFTALLSPLVEELRPPALELLQRVNAVLRATGVALIVEGFAKAAAVRDALLELFNGVLLACKEATEDFLNKYIDCEVKVMFTKDPMFIVQSNSWPEELAQLAKAEEEQLAKAESARTDDVPADAITAKVDPSAGKTDQTAPKPETAESVTETKPAPDAKERKALLVREMRKRVDLYAELSVARVGDAVPKIITNFLINELLAKLYFNMFRRAADPIVLSEIREPEYVVQQRAELTNTLSVLQLAKKVLLTDTELNFAATESES